MRILFVGNTNNYPLMLALAARSAGHDVFLVLDKSDDLHRPYNRFPKTNFEGWVFDAVDHTSKISGLINPNYFSKITNIKTIDLIIANGTGIASVAFLKLPTFCLLTGSDITFYASYRSLIDIFHSYSSKVPFYKKIIGILGSLITIHKQRKSISSAFGISHFAKGVVPKADLLLKNLSHKNQVFYSFVISDTLSIYPTCIARDKDNTPLKVMNVARLNWLNHNAKGISTIDMKGTDILLNGFAKFLSKSCGKSKLLLFRKGLNISETFNLVKHLNICGSIIWHDQVSQSEIFSFYENSDVVVDQLSTSFVGMGGLDAMASGRPLIANTRMETWTDSYNFKGSPILSAVNADDVCSNLMKLYENVCFHKQVARDSHEYVRKHKNAFVPLDLILSARQSYVNE